MGGPCTLHANLLQHSGLLSLLHVRKVSICCLPFAAEERPAKRPHLEASPHTLLPGPQVALFPAAHATGASEQEVAPVLDALAKGSRLLLQLDHPTAAVKVIWPAVKDALRSGTPLWDYEVNAGMPRDVACSLRQSAAFPWVRGKCCLSAQLFCVPCFSF